MIVLMTMALAGEPVVTLTEDSWIEGHVDIAASPEEVFATVSTPAAVAAIDGTVRATATPQGNCIAVQTEASTPSPLRPTRRYPAPTGSAQCPRC